MRIDNKSTQPIFIQIAHQIEENILAGVFEEESQVPSTTELSTTLKINPQTVLKGMNLLVDEGILYKKRGLGMFVTVGSVNKIHKKRKTEFLTSYIDALISEAKTLDISSEELMIEIEKRYNNDQN